MKVRKIKTAVSIHAAFPPSYHRWLAQAARATALAVPQNIWKQSLGNTQSAQISIAVITPKKMQSLNRQYRGKDKPTDVLSFSGVPGALPGLLGDVLLCWSVARKQIHAFGTTPRQEAQRLVIHGVLHLFGYDHERPAEARRMFALQEGILRGLTRG